MYHSRHPEFYICNLANDGWICQKQSEFDIVYNYYYLLCCMAVDVYRNKVSFEWNKERVFTIYEMQLI